VHDIPSWVVAGLSAVITGAAVWGAFRAVVMHRLGALERRLDVLDEERREELRALHELDKHIAVISGVDEITARIRRLPEGDKS
jgi:hypothetical protein